MGYPGHCIPLQPLQADSCARHMATGTPACKPQGPRKQPAAGKHAPLLTTYSHLLIAQYASMQPSSYQATAGPQTQPPPPLAHMPPTPQGSAWYPCCRRQLPSAQAPKDQEGRLQRTLAFVESLKKMPIAINTAEANQQHYEVRAVLAQPPTLCDTL